ncbi:hypothetical protein TRV_08097 [Trichophyton verrucosum HKI 0517]|uniref:Uncharacterized protein n=1 Tax=Trichophyton verrucosum (strain HKI 0517) TaxID=663202 RepID=D4DLM3_TRIVH|nr:uncharacterized protein TRV_08097 [Trichophyton verrucosum HKI 0517]EFE37252.1 hypothetical protein TRV_08097 [Trichophyton verrucosum HKI 0517]
MVPAVVAAAAGDDNDDDDVAVVVAGGVSVVVVVVDIKMFTHGKPLNYSPLGETGGQTTEIKQYERVTTMR